MSNKKIASELLKLATELCAADKGALRKQLATSLADSIIKAIGGKIFNTRPDKDDCKVVIECGTWIPNPNPSKFTHDELDTKSLNEINRIVEEFKKSNPAFNIFFHLDGVDHRMIVVVSGGPASSDTLKLQKAMLQDCQKQLNAALNSLTGGATRTSDGFEATVKALHRQISQVRDEVARAEKSLL